VCLAPYHSNNKQLVVLELDAHVGAPRNLALDDHFVRVDVEQSRCVGQNKLALARKQSYILVQCQTAYSISSAPNYAIDSPDVPFFLVINEVCTISSSDRRNCAQGEDFCCSSFDARSLSTAAPESADVAATTVVVADSATACVSPSLTTATVVVAATAVVEGASSDDADGEASDLLSSGQIGISVGGANGGGVCATMMLQTSQSAAATTSVQYIVHNHHTTTVYTCSGNVSQSTPSKNGCAFNSSYPPGSRKPKRLSGSISYVVIDTPKPQHH
jgi:hypothetical protein